MLLIRNGNLHLPGGEVLAKCDLLSQEGRIVRIGRGLSAPDARTLDAAGKEVLPGFILPVTSVGLTDYANLRQGDANEVSSPNQAGLHVRYALDSREVALQRYWLSGITSFGAAPGGGAVLAGQMGVYHITGRNASQMCVKDTVAVKGNFTAQVKSTFGGKGKAPMTRMGMAAQLREALGAAKRWTEEEKPEPNANNAALARVLSGELPLLMNVHTAGEISAVLDAASDFGVKVILNTAYQAHLVLDVVRRTNTPVLLGDLFDRGARIEYGTDVDAVLSLKESGLPVGLSCSSGGAGRENLLWNACRLVQMGYASERVLDMMTAENARILGVDGLTGSIAEGLWADFAVYNGNPLERWDAEVAATVVAGETVYTKEGGAVC